MIFRAAFAPDLEGLPVHRFLKSVHNTTIERGWLQLRLNWGDNVKLIWDEGAGIYDENNVLHLYVHIFISLLLVHVYLVCSLQHSCPVALAQTYSTGA